MVALHALAAVQASYAVAFLAGLLSVLSPCVFPLIPVYAAYLGGRAGSPALAGAGADVALAGAGGRGGAKARVVPARVPVLANGAAFVVGFTAVFVAVYYVLRALEVAFFIRHQREVNLVGGAIVVILALQTMGVLRLGALMRDRRIHLPPVAGVGGSFLVGLAFAAGWSPCLGPQLAAIIQLADQGDFGGLPFMLVYSAGLAIPFLAVAALADRLQGAIRAINRRGGIINLVAGSVLLLFGLLLMLDRITFLSRWSFQSPFNL